MSAFSSLASGNKSPTTRPTQSSSVGLHKRTSSSISTKRTLEQKGGEKPRGRGIKELNDAPPLSQQDSGALAFIDFRAVSSRVALCISMGKRLVFCCHTKLAANTPHTQELIRAHAHKSWFQTACALLLLLVLRASQHSGLPQNVSVNGLSRWVEVPMSLVMAVKFNRIGSRITSFCAAAASCHI